MAWVAIVIASTISAVAGGAYAHHYVTYEVPRSQIVVTVSKDLEKCGPQFPLLVTVLNGSAKTVARTWVYVSARLPERSTDYAKRFDALENDRLIPPGEGWRQCRSAPINAYAPGATQVEQGALVWSLADYRIAFE